MSIAGAVECDGAVISEKRALLAEDGDRLLDAFGEKLQRARIGAGVEASGDELRARDHVPAFSVDGNFCCRQRIEIGAGHFGSGSRDSAGARPAAGRRDATESP